jgi:dolichol-phosphate mannosyltransferase
VPSPPTVSVVLPTLNERDALERLAPLLRAALAPFSAEVIVVDDGSTDGTEALVRGWQAEGGYRLLERGAKKGLASAVADGLRLAAGEVVVVMDADGSHAPESVPELLRPVLDGRAELALGSRAVPGGSAPGLTLGRRLLSWGAALLARPLTTVRDPMSGFFAVRRSVVARAPLSPIGYKIGLEILVRCRPRPLVEVPIRFAPRWAGESKLGGVQIVGYLRHLARLYAWVIVGGRTRVVRATPPA